MDRRVLTSGLVALVGVATMVLAPLSSAHAATSSYHVVASKRSIGDASGQTWTSDASYAVGGAVTTSTHTIANTATPALYRAQRTGVMSYAFPVSAPGTYSVVLYVAELGGLAPGQRAYNVQAEGQTVAPNVDVARDAGPNAAWHVLTTAAVTDGTLNISFAPLTSAKPAVSAVAVTFLKSALVPETAFDDQFDGVSRTTDPAWAPDVRPGYNNELENDTANNATYDGSGHLLIQARQETNTDAATGAIRSYSSASLSTTGHFNWKYGDAEASIQAPPGTGLWPAFWATGTVNTWPAEGEIDGMELKGQEPLVDYGTIHAATKTGAHWQYGLTTTAPAPLTASWHTYGMVWLPGAISTSVDGKVFMTVTPADVPSGDQWPFTPTDPEVLRLDLAVGGNFVGSPDTSTVFPANMLIDYVHVTD